jgi:hypothetical protein
MLDQFFEFNASEMIDRHFSGRMKRIGILPLEQLRELLKCAIDCQDISERQANVVRQTFEGLSSSP